MGDFAMNANDKVVGIDNTGHAKAMIGTLKLFTDIKIDSGDDVDTRYCRNLYKRVTLATYYGVKSTSDFGKYVAKFKFLNPNIKNAHINYEYVIREFG
jgi:hypothetical protein